MKKTGFGLRGRHTHKTFPEVFLEVMRTNIDIDDELLAKAQKIAGTATKKATVEHALRDLVRGRQRSQTRELLGTVDWTGDLDQSRSG